MTTPLTRTQYVRWRTAVFAIFLISGLSMSSWASRTPAIRQTVGLERTDLGLMLLVAGCASIVGVSLAPTVLARIGARRGMLVALMLIAIAVATVGVGTDVLRSWPVVMIGLTLSGFANGALDVMMNVEASDIEKQGGKTILPLFHAFFSVGTVIGAGIGALLIGWHLDVTTHLIGVAVFIAVAGLVAIAFVPHRVEAPVPAAERAPWRERIAVSLSAWREPRTYLLGIVMLGMAFVEGGANDWIALGVTDGHHGDQALGAYTLAIFSAAMTLARVFGGPLVDRFGRVATLRVLAAAGVVGILLYILAPNEGVYLAGAALWGFGASLGFPIGMSAAGDDPKRAAARVSAVATIGYVAFLAGPPALGWISDHIGILNTMYILVGLVALSGLFSAAVRPLPGATVGAGKRTER